VLAVWVKTRDTSMGSQIAPSATPVAQVTGTVDPEVAVLRAQLEEMRRADDRIMQVVNNSLATLAVVAALLVGFSWFSGVRIASRERTQITKEIRDDLSGDFDRMHHELEGKLEEIGGRVGERVATELKKSEEAHEAQFGDLQANLAATQYGLLETMARTELSFGNYNEVLSAALVMITIGQSANLEDATIRGLDLAQSALERGARPGGKLESEVYEAVDGLPSKFSTAIRVLKEQLAKLRERANSEAEFEG
jgi:hypothetical protein